MEVGMERWMVDNFSITREIDGILSIGESSLLQMTTDKCSTLALLSYWWLVTEIKKENCFVGNVAIPIFSCTLSFTKGKPFLGS